MKPYNERLPLIDAAIDYHKSWPKHNLWCLVQIKDAGRWLYAFTGRTLTGRKFICTRDEFNQRKAERQNKPSFDDHPDAKCFVQNGDGWWDKNTKTGEVRPDGDWGWKYSVWKYGIGGWHQIQEGTVIGNWQDTLEKRPEPKEQDMNNDWYEKGEVPPVGEVVEVFGGKYGTDEMTWKKSEVYAHVKGRVLAESTSHAGVYKLYLLKELRPIPTETDKMVEQLKNESSLMDMFSEKEIKVIADFLNEQGYRKIKPMSESEFILSAMNFGVSGQGAKVLFNRGLRFIDKG